MDEKLMNKNFLIRFDRKDVSIALRPDGADVKLRDGLFRVAPGGPAIPGQMVEIALETGESPKSLKARALTTEKLLDGPVFVRTQEAPGISGRTRLKPKPAKNRRRDLVVDSPAAPRRKVMAPISELYEAAKDEPIAELRGMNVLGGVPVVSIYVRPIRLDKNKNLMLYSTVEVSISTEPDHRHDLRSMFRKGPRAIRYRDMATSMVLNPEEVAIQPSIRANDYAASETERAEEGMPPGSGLGGSLPGLAALSSFGPNQVDYLIITDDHSWNPDTFTPGPSLGNIVGAFQPLLDHKRKRGLRTHLALVTNIVNGVYGDYRTGACDLQECLRRFLQAYTYSRGVEWVLIGGDINIVPIRRACGSLAHGVFGPASGEPASLLAGDKVPQAGEYSWKGTFLALRLQDDVANNPGQIGQPDHILTMLKSGTKVPRVNSPSGNDLCWFYTDSTWITPSADITSYVRVNGPPEIINDEPQWYTSDNLIPTDLYYASLFGPDDLKLGFHDWNHLDNGLYGQWSWDKNLGEADYTPDISVGRAPVCNEAEAKTFVNKIISYETADVRPAEYDRFTRILLVAEHWDHGAASVGRWKDDSVVPPQWSYSYSYYPAKNWSVVRAEGLAEGTFPQLLVYLPGGGRREIPYDTHSNRSWYYAKSDTDLSASVFTLPLLDIEIPIRTEFVVVRSPDPAELTPTSYFFDPNNLDGSIADIEKIRTRVQNVHPRISQVQRIYTDEEDLDALSTATSPVEHFTQSGVIANINAGPHLVALSGHGNWPGCCGLDSRNNVSGLSNGSRTSIVYADSCLTANLDGNCLGKVILCQSGSGGAVGYVGYSRWGWIGTGTLLQQDFFRQLATERHFGLMVDAARRMWVDGYYGRWHALSTMVLGCPEMPMFLDDQDAKPCFIANTNTKELHERFCPWVRLMSLQHEWRVADKAIALAAGYDGCGFCLREHHTK